MKYLFVVIALFALPAKAEFTPFVGAFLADRSEYHGVGVGFSVGDQWIAQIEVAQADNLSGGFLSVGRRFGDLTVLAGVVETATFEPRSGVVSVAGVDVFDSHAYVDVSSTPVFIEASLGGLFIRHTQVDTEYTLKGIRIVRGFPVAQAREVSESDSITYIGYRVRF